MNKISAIFILAIAISCNSADKKTAEKKDKYEQTKETLEQTEKKNPTRFLSASINKERKNLIGEKVVIGQVTNNAKVAAYKDVEVEISYYSKTGAFLMSTTDVVYDLIKPGENASFKNKEFAPKGTDSVSVKVVNAKAE
ncbi:MAG: hypothetical protein IPP48_03675 [Chitinophagaceae bacterium]|nr:hypothetical protein [Chitinophagaceae bacterium]